MTQMMTHELEDADRWRVIWLADGGAVEREGA